MILYTFKFIFIQNPSYWNLKNLYFQITLYFIYFLKFLLLKLAHLFLIIFIMNNHKAPKTAEDIIYDDVDDFNRNSFMKAAQNTLSKV